ncbi:MAG: 50S ribosomal protein L4 [Bacteroidetes bacterium]|jgi:large subunit ribosomal protein L4|nr:50S ribosomal protein L4 [Bacteroidota bacterium]PKP35737.1 MAG: 50S ribosomal protein L4 [Bacteroidetes bacterium HGW-Bacteroidetes-17]
MELVVHNISGKETSKKVNLNDEIFGIEPNDHAIYLDTKQYLANQRQGTHSSKGKSELSGSTRKIKRQKGTGTARAGSIKSGLFRGGARMFGPQPRDYRFKLNKKLKRLARKSALSYKAIDKNIMVVEDFEMEPKTKSFIEMLNNFSLSEKKTLFILGESKENIYLAARNLKKIKVVHASALNTYDILNANNLLISENSLAEIEKMFV